MKTIARILRKTSTSEDATLFDKIVGIAIPVLLIIWIALLGIVIWLYIST